MTPHAEYLVRIAVGSALGGAIGIERERLGQQIGLRTNILVAMASATFTVVSTQFVYFQHYGGDAILHVDPSRIASTVVTGIGFLAGGAILRQGATIHGLTTGAALWLAAAIGMCSGAALYVEAVAVTAMGVVTLAALRRLEGKNRTSRRRRISLVLGEGAPTLENVVKSLEALGVIVFELDYDQRVDEERPRARVTIDARLPSLTSVDAVVAELQRQPGVRRVRVSATSSGQ